MNDDGSLEFLFQNIEDDGIREEILDFGEAKGDENGKNKKAKRKELSPRKS
ncbi:MAG: hypothetical protein LBI43_04440 [Streptococcaceae bacterium]|jgi:hypothetical protein|nr:hypothetical protein [Streptococcaceae bacterium]